MMPPFAVSRTWRRANEHGEQTVTVTLAGDFPSRAQAIAEADAHLRRIVGFCDEHGVLSDDEWPKP